MNEPFYFDGKVLRTLDDLLSEVRMMSKDLFIERLPDFVNWLRGSLGLDVLAHEVSSVSSPEEFISVVSRSSSIRVSRLSSGSSNSSSPGDSRGGSDTLGSSGDYAGDELADLHESLSIRYSRMADHFDGFVKRVNERLNSENEDFIKEYNILHERYEDAKSRISDLRRKGKNPVFAWFKLRLVPSKLSYALSSNSLADLESAKSLIVEVEKELDEESLREEIDVKREVESLAGSMINRQSNK